MNIRSAICAAVGAAALASAAEAQEAARYHESRSTAPTQGTYFYAYYPRSAHRLSVIIAFDQAAARLDDAAALLVTQSIDCDTRQISTERYAAYGDDGALLRESQDVPAETATMIGADIWAQRLNSGCEPPSIPVAIDPPPPPAFDREFYGRVASPAEAIALLRARADARARPEHVVVGRRLARLRPHRAPPDAGDGITLRPASESPKRNRKLLPRRAAKACKSPRPPTSKSDSRSTHWRLFHERLQHPSIHAFFRPKP